MVGLCVESGLVVSVEYNKIHKRHEIVLIKECTIDGIEKVVATTLILNFAK